MLTYIEGLKNKLNNTNSKEENKSIISLLLKEKDWCIRIIDEYLDREVRAWIKCEQICEHEKEIIKQIDEILYNN